MQRQKHSFREKVQYHIDNFMSKGGFSVFSALMILFIAAFIIMSAIRLLVHAVSPETKLSQLASLLWQVFLQVLDAGSIAEDNDLGFLHKIAGVVTVFLGLILFSSLVAFITSQFEAKIEELKKGRSNVIEHDHTLILGFGERVLEIIRELIIANESEKDKAIVVLAEKDKTEMDDFFRDRIADTKTTRIVTRSGSTSSTQVLRRVSITTAHSVVILNEVRADAQLQEKETADSRVLKTIMAVMACVGEKNLPPVVAELHLPNMQKLARTLSPNISIIDEHSMLAKLMVQTSRTPGLAQVYDNLVGFESCEFYFYRPARGMAGITYGELVFRFAESSVIGVRTNNSEIILNPDPSFRLGEDDDAILIAEDDSTIRYLANPLSFNAPAGKPAVHQERTIENQLIIGWSTKTTLIAEEYGKYMMAGSTVDVIVPEFSDTMQKEFSAVQKRNQQLKMRLIKTDIHNPKNLEKLKPERYNNVIILAGDGGDAERRDSETITELLEFRHYFKKIGADSISTQLITEVADSDNIEVIREAGVKDFLISNQFVSKIYAQVSENPDVLAIYEDLFQPEGSEIYIKPVSMYFLPIPAELCFGEICAAAQLRKETAIGVRIVREEKDRERHYGIYINPAKNQIFILDENDMIITLAEDEL